MGATLTDAPPAEALELKEAAVLLEESAESGAIGADGLVTIHAIRPTIGKGRGSHLYEAKMLEENAQKFVGWKMYLNHLSPAAKKAAGGLPRDWEDFAGVIKEATWDPAVPAEPDKGFGAGAVVVKAKPFGLATKLAEEFPEVLEASISTHATGVQPRNVRGQRVWVVEGFADRGSLDFVTEAGAGGKVIAAIQEARMTEEGALEEALETLSDSQFIQHMQDKRPALLEALSDEDKRAAALQESGTQPNTEEDEVEITPEALQEALQSEAGQKVLDDLVREKAAPIIEEAVSEERDRIRAASKADFDRELQLRELRESAHALVEETKLPERLKNRVKADFSLSEFGPTEKLDQFDDVDEQGAVTKSALAKVQESVQEEIAEARAIVAEIKPTRVTGQGPSVTVEEAERGGKKVPEKPEGQEDKEDQPGRYAGTMAASLVQEARLDPATAWDGV